MRPIILALVWLETVAVAADYTLQIGNIHWTGGPGGYDCFSDTAYPNTVDFILTKQVPGRRSYAVGAGPSANTGGYQRQLVCAANRLNYQLYTSSGLNYVLKAPPAALPNEVLSGWSAGGRGTAVPLAFVLYVPPGQIVPPGTYTDQVAIGVYRRWNDPAPPMDTRTVAINVVVIPKAALAVVPTGAAFSGSTSQHLHFGNLVAGTSLGCDLLVRRNTGCDLTFASLHGGVLRLRPTPTEDRVPYTCAVNGLPLNLSSPARLSLPSGVSPSLDGNRLPVKVTIGDLGDAAAGDYQDEITITVVAQ